MKSTYRIKHNLIFIDTSGWIELVSSNEIYHVQVKEYFTHEVKQSSKFFTSDYVLDETYTRLLMQNGISEVRKFKTKISITESRHQLLTLGVDDVIRNKGWDAFIKYAEHKLSFTDATSLVLVQDIKINEILTLDQGFMKAGLIVKPEINL